MVCLLSLYLRERRSDKSRPELKREHTLLYTPYPGLADVFSTDGSAQITRIEQYIHEKQWSSARNASSDLIQLGLDGLHYLQTYDRFLIKAIVTAAYTGWVAFASLYILRPRENILTSRVTSSSLAFMVNTLSGLVLLFFWVLFAVQKSPLMFYVYIAFPCYFWQQFLAQIIPLVVIKVQDEGMKVHHLRFFLNGGMAIIALLGMVVCSPS